jgi:hypothetical protein
MLGAGVLNSVGLENLRLPYKCKQAAIGLKVPKGTNARPAGRRLVIEQIGNEESSRIERQEMGGNRTGLQKTARPMGPMTVEHEQWDEFVDGSSA